MTKHIHVDIVNIAETVNDVTGVKQITDMWKNQFSMLLNSSTVEKNSHQDFRIDNMRYERFTPEDIAEALVSLKSGKSPGLDNIYGEHLQHAHFKLNCILYIIFNCMIIHGYLPLSVMDTIIVPLVKDKKGELGSVFCILC